MPSKTAELGPCLTDATREGRSRRATLISAAMLAPEHLRQQSLRRSDPVEPCQPPFRIANLNIQAVHGRLSRQLLSREASRPEAPCEPAAQALMPPSGLPTPPRL